MFCLLSGAHVSNKLSINLFVFTWLTFCSADKELAAAAVSADGLGVRESRSGGSGGEKMPHGELDQRTKFTIRLGLTLTWNDPSEAESCCPKKVSDMEGPQRSEVSISQSALRRFI